MKENIGVVISVDDTMAVNALKMLDTKFEKMINHISGKLLYGKFENMLGKVMEVEV